VSSANGNGHHPELERVLKVVERMERVCIERERRGSLYFTAEGKLLPMTGNHYRHAARGEVASIPQAAVYIVDDPFRPSAASLADMVQEHEQTGERVIYCEERWEIDPRIEEQAGPSLLEDWMIVEFFEKRVMA
jgi:hypothetical protein